MSKHDRGSLAASWQGESSKGKSMVRSRSWGKHLAAGLSQGSTRSSCSTNSTLRASPPEHLPPPPPNVAVAAVSNNNNSKQSPGTPPPKKVWERHYRSFLSRRKDNSNKGSVVAPSLPSITSSSDSTNHISSSGTARLPVVKKQPSTSDNNNTDESVRGGSLFGNMFRTSSTSSSQNNNGSSKDALDVTTGNRQRTRSANDLDGTRRRGSEKSYASRSPKSPTQRKSLLDHRNTKTTRSVSANNMDLDGTRRNGTTVSPGSSRQQVVEASSHHIIASDLDGLQPPGMMTTGRELKRGATLLEPRFSQPKNMYSIQSSLMGTSPIILPEGFAPPPSAIPPPPASSPTFSTHSPGTPLDFPGAAGLMQTPPTLKHILASDIVTKPTGNASSSSDQKLQSSAMKKAFTEFHNSSQTSHDAAAAFLGEDTSFHGQGLLYPQNQRFSSSQSHHSSSSLSQQQHVSTTRIPSSKSHGSLMNANSSSQNNLLDTVHENVAIKPNERMLKPIQGVDVWQTGRRYLIGPAALATSSVPVLQILGGNGAVDVMMDVQAGAKSESSFGAIVLGQCLLSFVGGAAHATTQRWSSAVLVLRQNYLLEYDARSSNNLAGRPRGYAHLQLSTCRKHPDFHDAVELRYFSSPCSQTDPRTLMIRLNKTEERDYWIKCLNRAARLSIDDLYVYDEDNTLGKGQYATVYAGKRRVNANERIGNASDEQRPKYTCALKVFDKSTFWKLVVKGRERADTLVRETAVQASFTAACGEIDSFLCIRGFFETSENVVLELDLMEGTDLFGYISTQGNLEEKEASRITFDALRCLEAMNRLGMAHRDIKPANILMCHPSEDGPRVKVCDFGMSTFRGVDGQVRGRCGTPGYVAPEIFRAGIHGGYGNKIDIFSLGVTLYVMLCGYEPFYGETDSELVEANKAAEIEFDEDWSDVSNDAKDLIQRLMEPDPKKRLDVSNALRHPWILEHTDRQYGARMGPSIEESNVACAIS